MQMTLGEISEFLGCELIGDAAEVISGLSSLESAEKGELTFAAEAKYLHRINEGSASAYIVIEELKEKVAEKNLLVCKNPYYSFARLLSRFYENERQVLGIDKNVIIAKSASVSEQASIYPNVFIDSGAVIEDGVVIYPGCFIGENVTINENTIVYPNVVIREETVVGRDVIIHSGVVIGADGFGYVLHEGKQHKVPQIGRVIIEDRVEIGANVTIDRAALGETVIGEGTKIDNLVMVAHNVKIGKDCVLVAQAGIAGSTTIGDSTTLAAQAGVIGHVKIGDNVVIAARSGVTHALKDGAVVAGYPAMELAEWRKKTAVANKLPEMRKKILELEKRIEELERDKG